MPQVMPPDEWVSDPEVALQQLLDEVAIQRGLDHPNLPLPTVTYRYLPLPTVAYRCLPLQVAIQRGLDHPNVARVFDVFVDREKNEVCFVMQLCAGGSISQHLAPAVAYRCLPLPTVTYRCLPLQVRGRLDLPLPRHAAGRAVGAKRRNTVPQGVTVCNGM